MNLLETPRGRKLLFAALYFLEGAPIGFVWWSLPAALRVEGHPVERIGALTSLLVLPWTAKVLWAPVVDALVGRRFAERGFVVAAQVAMIASLLPLVVWGTGDLALVTTALLVHAFAAATQDVSIDALCIRCTVPEERGSVNAWMNAGMLAGRSVFASGALVARARIGDRAVLLALVAVLTAGLLVALVYRAPAAPRPGLARTRELRRRLLAAVRDAGTWRLLAFAAVGGAGFEVLGALLGPLIVDTGGSEDLLATFYGVPGWAAPLAGGFVGARVARSVGIRVAVVASGAFLALTVVGAALGAALGLAPATLLFGPVLAVYLGIGAFTATSYALFMDRTDPSLGATQFSAFMGATNLCESWSANVGGRLAASEGYPTAFSLLALVSVAALVLIPRSRAGRGARSL